MATPNVVVTLSDFLSDVPASKVGYLCKLSDTKQAYTNSSGVATITSVTPGDYTLQIFGVGLEDRTVTVTDVAGPLNAIDIVTNQPTTGIPGGVVFDETDGAEVLYMRKSNGTLFKLVGVATALLLCVLSLNAAGPKIGQTELTPRADFDAATNSLTLGGTSNVTFSNVTANGYLSLSGATNRLTVAGGSLKLDGSAITGSDGTWTNDNGTITGTSTVADGASAVAFQLESSNTLANAEAKLVSLQNNGTNYAAFNKKGHLWIGSVDSGNDADVSVNHATIDGTGDTKTYILYQFDGRSYNVDLDTDSAYSFLGYTASRYIDFYIDATNAFMGIDPGTGYVVVFEPTAAATATAHKLGTTISHTSGKLLEVSNNGTNRVSVGAVNTAGQTPLYLWDADNSTLQQVTLGAADSGGSGFRVLRIPNAP